MALTFSHVPHVIDSGSSPCARCHVLTALCEGQSLALALTEPTTRCRRAITPTKAVPLTTSPRNIAALDADEPHPLPASLQ